MQYSITRNNHSTHPYQALNIANRSPPPRTLTRLTANGLLLACPVLCCAVSCRAGAARVVTGFGAELRHVRCFAAWISGFWGRGWGGGNGGDALMCFGVRGDDLWDFGSAFLHGMRWFLGYDLDLHLDTWDGSTWYSIGQICLFLMTAQCHR